MIEHLIDFIARLLIAACGFAVEAIKLAFATLVVSQVLIILYGPQAEEVINYLGGVMV